MNTIVYWKEAKYEFLKRLRVPAFTLSTLGFPLMFYALFGLAMGPSSFSGVRASAYLLATYGTFGVLAVCLFGFAVSLAIERELGWLELKQASPLPPAAYFFAKITTCLIFSIVLIALMLTAGLWFGHVQLPAGNILRLAAILIAGTIPFGALGIALGYFASATAAPSFVNMIYLPMSFCSGLWIPFPYLPKAVQHIAPFMPAYHLSQIALSVLGASKAKADWNHWGALAGLTLLFLGIARLAYQRDQSHKSSIL